MIDLEPLVAQMHALQLGDVPEIVISAAADSFANVAGVAIGGLNEDAPRRALAVTAMLGSAPQARVLGTGEVRNLEHAALVNGIAAHVLDFDDTDLATIYHPSAVLYGAIWPLAEWVDADGRDAMAAWIVGLETGIRIAAALGMPHYDRGWHVTGTAGAVAAAAAAARLLRLGQGAFASALNLAATMSGGHRTQFGFDAKSGHVGFAAQRGLLAALLAREGFSASPLGVTGPRGLLGVVGPDGPHSALTDRLGNRWRLLDNRLKPYASGVVTHPAIDAAREVGRRFGRDAPGFEAITLRVHPLVVELTGLADPQTGLQGKFSVRHCFAIGLLYDRAAAEEFTDVAVRDGRVRSVRELVDVVADPSMPHMTTAVTVRLAGGETHEIPVTDVRGSDLRPLSPSEVEAKFVGLLEGRLGKPDSLRWFERLRAVRSESSMASLAREFDASTCI